MGSRRGTFGLATIAALAVVCAFAPSASATIVAYNEPTFTKTSGNNAFFFNWVAVNGVDSNGVTNYTYYLCINTYRNNLLDEASNGTQGPGSANCTNSLRGGSSPASGGACWRGRARTSAAA